MKEDEFLSLLEEKSRGVFGIGGFLLEDRDLSEDFYEILEKEAHLLETFMDNYRARGNETFVHFAELVVSLRWFCRAARSLEHVAERYKHYHLRGIIKGREREAIIRLIEKSLDFCRQAIKKLFAKVERARDKLGMRAERKTIRDRGFFRRVVADYLPQNVRSSYMEKGERNVVNFAFRYAAVTDRAIGLGEELEESDVRVVVDLLVGVEGMYDNKIRETAVDKEDERLKSLRGLIPLMLHLLEAVEAMLHFQERRGYTVRHEEIRDKIFSIVDQKRMGGILMRMVKRVKSIAEQGREVATSLLEEYAEMAYFREKVMIPKGSILHLRPASIIVKIAKSSKSPLVLQINKREVRADSILDIIPIFADVADILESKNVEMVIQGDKKVVKEIKEKFLEEILEPPK